jgi:peptide/nickel transport system substrate-binding protein
LNYEPNSTPRPELARAWEIASDGKTMTFQLRPGVTWHDGAPFTSADVKFTIENVIKRFHSRGRSVFANVTQVDTPDPLTAVFRLSHPAPYIMAALNAAETPMVPKHIYENGDVLTNPANNAPIGTGPFRFAKWDRGSYIRLERNPTYFEPDKPYLDRIVYRFIPDAGARAVAFESGELDVGGPWPVPASDLARLAQMPKLAITTKGYSALADQNFLEFNLRDPLFQDIRVRQAIAHSIERRFIIDNIFFGYATPATGPISPEMTAFYDADVPQYPYDLATAERLLDEAGRPRGKDGKRFSLTIDPMPYGDRFMQIGQYIAQALPKIGISVELRSQDASSWLRRIYTDYTYQAHIYGIFNMMDPTIGVQRQYWSKAIRPGLVFANGSGYSNPEVDAIFEQAQIEGDQTKRKQLFRNLQRIVATDLPNIPLVNEQQTTVYNRRVQNLDRGLVGVYDTFADVYVTA